MTREEDIRRRVAMNVVTDTFDARVLLAELDSARSLVCLLLDGHLSPSDEVRAEAIRVATKAREGWER